MSSRNFDASRAAAIILGARVFPNYPELELHGDRFQGSAASFGKYLKETLGVPRTQISDLFDHTGTPSDVLKEVSKFLQEMTATAGHLQDLFLFYVGHGFLVGGDRGDLCLALRQSHVDELQETSLEMARLASVVRARARFVRRYVILDCCYGAAAHKAWSQSTGPHVTALQKTLNAFPKESPTQGTAVLSAAESNKEANAEGKNGLTTFSDGLTQCLKHGTPQLEELITFQQLHGLLVDYLRDNYKDTDRFVRPKVASPETSKEGDVALIPIFPNPARFRKSEPSTGAPLEEKLSDQPLVDARRPVASTQEVTPNNKSGSEITSDQHSTGPGTSGGRLDNKAIRKTTPQQAVPADLSAESIVVGKGPTSAQQESVMSPNNADTSRRTGHLLDDAAKDGTSEIIAQPRPPFLFRRLGVKGLSLLCISIFILPTVSIVLPAFSGSAQAQYRLGALSEAHFTTKYGEQQAAYWYRKAADQKQAAAAYALGTLYESGIGVTRSLVTAESWYKQASDDRVVEASYSLGVLQKLQLSKIDHRTGSDALERAIEYFRTFDDSSSKPEAGKMQYQSALCFLELRDKYHVQSMTSGGYYGRVQEIGSGLLQSAAGEGDSGAQILLGRSYIKSDLFEPDLALGQTELTAAALQRDPEAEYLLGISLIYYVPTQTEGFKWIQRAARQKWPAAMRDAGIIIQTGRLGDQVIPQQPDLTHTWLTFAAELGDTNAEYALKSPSRADFSMVGTPMSSPPLNLSRIRLLLSSHVPELIISRLVWKEGLDKSVDENTIKSLKGDGASKTLLITIYRAAEARNSYSAQTIGNTASEFRGTGSCEQFI